MQHASQTISKIAAALAKAQAEIANPEKSLTATIHAHSSREESRTFRYASLASGLEMIRKCLSKHEIAVAQATAIEPETGLIKLTTTLLHTSGEWISSDWPVCPASETMAPHRMGAALTYARRYALFTLVGIAGEDDLDAPDVAVHTPGPGPKNGPLPRNSGSNGKTFQRPRNGANLERAALLSSEASAILRDGLLIDLEGLGGEDELDAWTLRAWPKANTLTLEDGEKVKGAFQARLTQIQSTPEEGHYQSAELGPLSANDETRSRIDKSALALPEVKRLRDKQHLRFVAKQPCLVCGREPCDSHHLRFAQTRGLAQKVSDEFTVPLCRAHHRELHRAGKERVWWSQNGLEPLESARLWTTTHPTGAGG